MQEEEAGMLLDAIFARTFARFADVMDRLAETRPIEELHSELADIAGKYLQVITSAVVAVCMEI